MGAWSAAGSREGRRREEGGAEGGAKTSRTQKQMLATSVAKNGVPTKFELIMRQYTVRKNSACNLSSAITEQRFSLLITHVGFHP